VELRYFDNSAEFPAFIAIEIPPGILVCSCALQIRLLKVIITAGIIFENFIDFCFVNAALVRIAVQI
jgi:hypothetical protein